MRPRDTRSTAGSAVNSAQDPEPISRLVEDTRLSSQLRWPLQVYQLRAAPTDLSTTPTASYTKSRVKAPRNVHFLDARNKEVAGFWQNGSVSSYTPFCCLEAGDPEDPAGQHDPPIHMTSNRSTVDTGYYVLLAFDGSNVEINVTLERAIPRNISRSHTNPDPRTTGFRERVRARDRSCVVLGIEVPGQDFTSFHAAHIFPFAHLDLIHSIQTGILLSEPARSFFDKYMIAINPDNNYKVTCFTNDPWGFDGRHMILRDCPQRYQPLQALLKYHFRQAQQYLS
ncbi:hypothetical protein Egran_03929 [Elaphomyces granulatus]|uniref:HNH nuclease domain-containing protein n=1 Tax=Elaphomyces granulatus TaxID=519963 RepID=A0A232LW99_9EURO|nr:hypothetical protein Egran_03929 [Elaphomyces granulatus]